MQRRGQAYGLPSDPIDAAHFESRSLRDELKASNARVKAAKAGRGAQQLTQVGPHTMAEAACIGGCRAAFGLLVRFATAAEQPDTACDIVSSSILVAVLPFCFATQAAALLQDWAPPDVATKIDTVSGTMAACAQLRGCLQPCILHAVQPRHAATAMVFAPLPEDHGRPR